MKEIIEKYGASVKNIIKNFLGTNNEDIEQEIYIKTWKKLDEYKEQNKFSAWISKIASNTCRDYLKSPKNKVKNENDCEILENIKNDINIEKTIEQKERQARILKEIEHLPNKLKEVIVYFEFENRTYEEIAIILNKPTGTIRSRLHNAREILREKLKDLIDD